MPSFSELELRSIFEASLDAIMMTSPEGAIFSANAAACRLLGRSEVDLCRLGRDAVVDPHDSRLRAALECRERTGSFVGELSFLRANGDVFPAEISTSLYRDARGERRAILIFRDITERKRSEESLRISEERFAKAFHTSPDGITITRLADGRYLEVNEGFVHLSGYSPAEVIGKTSLELEVWPQSESRIRFAQELRERGEVINLEAEFQFKGGVIKTCLVSARRLEIDGEPCILSTTRDISERRKVAESLQQIQRLEALGVLAGGIAHDFNNMLGGIFGFLELAREASEHGRTEKLPYYLHRALGIHARAKGLTRQLLTFAKGGGPVRQVVSLGPLVRQSVTFALSGSEVQTQFELAEDLWLCDCDGNQIEQVIDNLVLNARQAMDGSGRLIVQAVNVKDPEGHVGPFVRISILDEGPGVPPEHLAKIFDPFFSTKSAGHGLGLSTVFSVVNRHGGWVTTQTTVGEGATFHVYLPAEPQRTEAECVAEPAVHRGSGDVLVMDDDEALLEVLEGWLTAMGYRVTTCRTGSSALERFENALRLGHPYRIVLLDLTVPGNQGGATVVQAMRKADPSVVLLVASGYSEDPSFTQPELGGFSARIAKPFLRGDLARVLEATLGPGEGSA